MAMSLSDPTTSSDGIVVSAGSADTTSILFWARTTEPFSGSLMVYEANNPVSKKTFDVTSDSNSGNSIKKLVSGLKPAMTYNSQFVSNKPSADGVLTASEIGRVKTALTPQSEDSLRFGFGSCANTSFGPLYSIADVPAQNLAFFIMQGDAIYESGNKRSAAVPQPFNTVRPNTPNQGAIKASVKGLQRKYLETISPIPTDGISPNGNLAPLYNSTGIYATYDNHETVDTALEAGGAPKNSIHYVSWDKTKFSEGGSFFREGVDLTGQNLANKGKTFLNQRPERKALINAWFENMPERNRGTIKNSQDIRSNGTQQLYYSQNWGKNATFFNVDDRTYRDAKITTIIDKLDAQGNLLKKSEDDVTSTLIDHQKESADRTILGKPQLKWLEDGLAEAQSNQPNGWKFVSISSPIDILGLPGDSGKPENGSLDVDGKSWWGNYRYERNELLKFIADKKINNVVFLSGDDHEARINQLSYAPDGNIDNITGYQVVPNAYIVVSSPIGATRPEYFQQAADNTTKNPDGLITVASRYSDAFTKSGLLPIGLSQGLSNLVSLKRNGITNYKADIQHPNLIDFWSPNTHNYGMVEVNSNGQLTASIRGIPPTTANQFPSIAPSVSEILSVILNPV